jgi:hypothetical protein
MHPVVTFLIIAGAGAFTFWLVSALVDRLQKGKGKNPLPLDSGPDESQNIDGHSE